MMAHADTRVSAQAHAFLISTELKVSLHKPLLLKVWPQEGAVEPSFEGGR